MLGRPQRRQVLQAIKYVYCGVKMLVAVVISPLLALCFITTPQLFLPVFTGLWPHLDIVGEDGSLYLRRWFMTPKTRWFRPRFLHHIARSDEGRDPHDHPGPFTTTILHGGYLERIYYPRNQGYRLRHGLYVERGALPGDTLVNGGGHTHMVQLLEPTWTWVVGWIRGQKWGFWLLDPQDASGDRWIESEEYGTKGVEIRSWE